VGTHGTSGGGDSGDSGGEDNIDGTWMNRYVRIVLYTHTWWRGGQL
jgi:hypothetical protein